MQLETNMYAPLLWAFVALLAALSGPPRVAHAQSTGLVYWYQDSANCTSRFPAGLAYYGASNGQCALDSAAPISYNLSCTANNTLASFSIYAYNPTCSPTAVNPHGATVYGANSTLFLQITNAISGQCVHADLTNTSGAFPLLYGSFEVFCTNPLVVNSRSPGSRLALPSLTGLAVSVCLLVVSLWI